MAPTHIAELATVRKEMAVGKRSEACVVQCRILVVGRQDLAVMADVRWTAMVRESDGSYYCSTWAARLDPCTHVVEAILGRRTLQASPTSWPAPL